MKKGIMLVLALGLMVFCIAKDTCAQNAPMIEKIWASPETAYGDTLRVYIMASDSDGDMKWVFVTAKWGKETVTLESENSVTGAPIRLGKGWQKNLNGYLGFDTKRSFYKDGAAKVEVVIEDSKGRESMPMSVSMKIVEKGAKAEKPPAEFKQISIGQIMAEPQPITP